MASADVAEADISKQIPTGARSRHAQLPLQEADRPKRKSHHLANALLKQETMDDLAEVQNGLAARMKKVKERNKR